MSGLDRASLSLLPQARPLLSTSAGYTRRMDLEERTLETVGEHCEECGAKLTDAELRQAMEAGGPALCTVHAAEATPLDPEALDEPA
jgi:hypothetical protein